MEQYMPVIWVVFSVFMIICEAATAQLVSIWFVIGGVSAAVTSIFTKSIGIQSAVFLVVSLVALLVTRPLVKKFRKKGEKISTNADRLIGQTGIMLTSIADNDDIGQAKVGTEVWSVKTNSAPLAENTKIVVLAIEGVKLIVEPVNKE